MKKVIKFGFIDKKLERKAPFPLVASDKNAYMLELDMSKYQNAKRLYIYARRADGEVVCDSVDINDKALNYTLRQSMYSVPGELIIRLVLTADGDNTLTAAEVRFEVLEGSCEGTPAKDYETVEDFIERLSEMETLIGEIDTVLDGIIAHQERILSAYPEEANE